MEAPAATREETLLTAAQDLHRGKPGFSGELEVPGALGAAAQCPELRRHLILSGSQLPLDAVVLG